MNVLIVPGTNGCALEIVRSLISMKNVNLYGAGNDLEKSKKFPYENFYFLPNISQKDSAITALQELIEDQEVTFDLVFLAHDQWIFECRNLVDTPNTTFIRHNLKATEIASYKSRTYEEFKHLLRVPKTYNKNEVIENFPIFAKPDRGQGSRGARKIGTQNELEIHLRDSASEEYVYSEFLEGPEYTIDCFSSEGGKLVFAQPRLRSKISGGIAVESSTVDESLFIDYARIISTKLNLAGAWFFQMKENRRKELYLLEIGLRPGGASGIQRLLGRNQSSAWIFQMQGHEIGTIKTDWNVSINQSHNEVWFQFDRAVNEIFVDFDDTILVNGSLNQSLVNYLQYSRKQGVPVTLISRHKGNLHIRLAELGLSSHFDQIIHIENNEAKSTYLRNRVGNILFIDDSYVEREEVVRLCGTNVLALDQTFPLGFILQGDAH